MILENISTLVQKGDARGTKETVEEAIVSNLKISEILNEGLIKGMSIIGKKFKNNEVYVPEVLIAARAMNAGMEILSPLLIENGVKPIGKAVIGTVKGDLHDIGKNLVSMMLKGAGIEVIDLGIDVSPETFIDKAIEVNTDILCMSALLTTTMPVMKEVIDKLKERDLKDRFVIMVGGAPITDSFAKEIGADYYTPDAASAAEKAKEILIEQNCY